MTTDTETGVTTTNPIKDLMDEMVQVERFAYTPMGTFGRMKYKDLTCYTVEKPWQNNAAYTSCIPVGIYKLKLGRYHRGKYDCYELCNVPNRTLIKIHVANTANDLMGCIALGNRLGTVDNWWAVLNSTETHAKFMAEMGRQPEAYIGISNLLREGEWMNPTR